MKMSDEPYSACEFCGSKVVEKRVTLHMRIKGKLHVFENVPEGRCIECGERVYKGPVLEQLSRLARSRSTAKKVVSMPVTVMVYRAAQAVKS
jgi:YgiT-type zinc finger domain-containing protein